GSDCGRGAAAVRFSRLSRYSKVNSPLPSETRGRAGWCGGKTSGVLAMAYPSPPAAGGGAGVTRRPTVFGTGRACPVSQVGLPFSRSMTNRTPVPEVRARSRCVTPTFLRVCRIKLPIWAGVGRMNVTVREYYLASGQEYQKILPHGNFECGFTGKY